MALAPQSDHGSAACAETEAFFQYGPPQSFFELSWLALQKARAREVAQRLMTGRKFLPPLLWLAPQSDHGSAACAETEAFLQYGPPCAGSWRSDDDRARISTPPLLWLVPQSDHGSAACAETEAFFQYGPPQSFFQLSWLALQKARSWRNDWPYKKHVRGKLAQGLMTGRISQPPPSSGSLRNPITGVPRARKLLLFSTMARNPFSSQAGSPYQKHAREKLAQR